MATTVKKSLELRSCQKCHNGKEEKSFEISSFKMTQQYRKEKLF